MSPKGLPCSRGGSFAFLATPYLESKHLHCAFRMRYMSGLDQSTSWLGRADVYVTLSCGWKNAMKRVEAIHRKLRSLGAVLKDTAATEHERANAEAIKTRLEKKLVEDGVAKEDWTDVVFRLGRAVQEIKKAKSPPASSSGTSKIAFRLGRTLADGLKKWRST